MKKINCETYYYIALFVFAVVTTIYFFSHVSLAGLGIHYDTGFYINAAQNMANGYGLTIDFFNDKQQPLAHFPPLLSLVYAFLFKFGLSINTAAILLNSCCMFASIFIVGAIFVRPEKDKYLISLYFTSIFAFSSLIVDTMSVAAIPGPR